MLHPFYNLPALCTRKTRVPVLFHNAISGQPEVTDDVISGHPKLSLYTPSVFYLRIPIAALENDVRLFTLCRYYTQLIVFYLLFSFGMFPPLSPFG